MDLKNKEASASDAKSLGEAARWMRAYAGDDAAKRLASIALIAAFEKDDRVLIQAALGELGDVLADLIDDYANLGRDWVYDPSPKSKRHALETGDALGMALMGDNAPALESLWEASEKNPAWGATIPAGLPGLPDQSQRERLAFCLLRAAILSQAGSCALWMFEQAAGFAPQDEEVSKKWWNARAVQLWKTLAACEAVEDAPWMTPLAAKLSSRAWLDKAWRQEVESFNDEGDEVVVAKTLTPLQAACFAGNASLAKALIDAGAKPIPGERSKELKVLWAGGWGAKSAVESRARAACLGALIEAGVACDEAAWLSIFENTCSSPDDFPLLQAALSRAGSMLDARDSRGATMLMRAAQSCSLEVAQAIIQAGANPCLSIKIFDDELTALDFARKGRRRSETQQQRDALLQTLSAAAQAWELRQASKEGSAVGAPRL